MHHGHLALLIHDKDRPAVAQPGIVDRDLDRPDPGAAAIPHLVRLTRIAHHDHRLERGDGPGYRRIVVFGPVEHRAPKGLSRPGRPGHQRGLVRPPFGWHAEPLFTGCRHGLPPVLPSGPCRYSSSRPYRPVSSSARLIPSQISSIRPRVIHSSPSTTDFPRPSIRADSRMAKSSASPWRNSPAAWPRSTMRA